MSMTCRAAAMVVVILGACGALGQDDCPDCGFFSAQPDIQQWLAEHGFSPSEYDVHFAWVETDVNGDPVFGYRIQSRSGGSAFDVYSDSSGALLDTDALAQAGVQPKEWSNPAIEVGPEVAAGDEKPIMPEPKSAASAKQAARLTLPALDKQTLMAEDRVEGPEKGPVRTGVFQVFDNPIVVNGPAASTGAWQTLPTSERVWSFTVVSPGAIGQRIHFTRLNVPEGYVLVYNADNPDERYGPFRAIPAVDSGFWSPTCFGEAVTVEIVCADADAVDVAMDRIVHVYRGLDELPWGPVKSPAGSCNLDFACYPAWLLTGNGVGGIGAVGAAGSLFCTGSLIVDTDPSTSVPYFLTANHCVPGAGTPDSVEVYWFYQRDGCTGTVADVLSVPRTVGGADLLATSSANSPMWTGTDFSLLRLRAAPPAGATYVGWTAKTQAVGQSTTCIHHPRGDYKRITFGNYTNNTDSCFIGTAPPATKYYQSTWSAGTTEGGSSGSPLLRSDNQRIVGQLWGGYASCTRLTCPDYYGRFDVSFPLMAAYLNPGGASRTVQLNVTQLNVPEGAGSVGLTVSLSAAPVANEFVEVTYTIGGGTATAGLDYTGTGGTIVFEELQAAASIVIPIVEEGVIESNEMFAITLSGSVGCAIGSNSSAIITIIDNDIDTDGDHISNYDENHGTFGYVTDPNNADTDDDGVDDGTEIALGFDPTDPGDVPSIPSLRVPWFR